MTIIYEKATGRVISCSEFPMPDSAITAAKASGLYETLEGSADPEKHYVLQGEITPIPERPNEWSQFNYLESQWVSDPVAAEVRVRAERARLLAKSDWTQLPDVPLESKEVWAAYRQLLRDITDQLRFPTEIQWPERPE